MSSSEIEEDDDIQSASSSVAEEEEMEKSGSEHSQSSENEDDGNFQILSKTTTCVENVGAVSTQLKVWDQLMAARIKMQQVMKFANCLALKTRDLSANHDVRKSARLSLKRAEKIQVHLESLTKSLLNSLIVEEENSCAFELNKEECFWQPILEQWWNKTCVPQADKKKSVKNNFAQLEESPVKYARRLMADKSTLVRRTQLKRLDYRVGGNDSKSQSQDSEYDPKVFDDNDFYQVLIRDVISKKLAGTTDPSAVTRTMLSGTKLTAEILKPKKQAVDRRASKGRKIRYNVMPKLVNYMGPDSSKILWTDQQRDELFKSLFQ